MVTGPLFVRSDNGCVYVRGPYEDATDLNWLRTLPGGYSARASGIAGPDGVVIADGEVVTVSGTVADLLGDTVCVSVHTLDVTSIH